VAYALAHAAIVTALVVPVVAWLWAWATRRRWLSSAPERLLLALVVAPLAPLAEVLGLSLLPIERPLRVTLPWAHLLLVAACLAMLVREHRGRPAAALGGLRRLRRVWRALDGATRAAVLIAGAATALAFVHGAWNAGDEHDGALYRMLVVVQPYQDGRVGRVSFPFEGFADAYPRTIELLCSWTMLCTGASVGFHLVSWYFLQMFALATYVLARRAGLRLRLSLLCAALAATTPMPIYLTGVLYNDLAAAAPLAAAIALGAPRRRSGWRASDLTVMAIALAIGASAKFSVAIGAAVLGAVRLGWMVVRGRCPRPACDVGFAPTLAALAAAAALASIPYVRSWVLYGSPLWPLRVEIGPWMLFEGPMAPEQLWITAQGSWAERWGAAIYKLFQTTSQDANGAFGLLFAVGVVPAAVVFFARTLRRPTLLGVLLAGMFWYVAIVPVSTNLRYSLHLLPVGYVMLALLLPDRPAGRGRRLITPVLMVMLAINAADYARTIVRETSAQLRWGVSLTDPARNRLWYMQFMYIEPGIAPETHEVVHRLVRPGERLVYSVHALGGLLYDPFFTYAVEYRSIEYFLERTRGERADDPGPSWLRSLRADGIDAVLVYAQSREARVLGAPGSPYELVYDQPDEPPSRRVHLYRLP
jgi:hypothetical protein